MKCPQCAEVVDEGARRCPECGTVLPRERKYVYGKSQRRRLPALPLEAKILLGAVLGVVVLVVVYFLTRSH